jgi:hypothetical protein
VVAAGVPEASVDALAAGAEDASAADTPAAETRPARGELDFADTFAFESELAVESELAFGFEPVFGAWSALSPDADALFDVDWPSTAAFAAIAREGARRSAWGAACDASLGDGTGCGIAPSAAAMTAPNASSQTAGSERASDRVGALLGSDGLMAFMRPRSCSS